LAETIRLKDSLLHWVPHISTGELRQEPVELAGQLFGVLEGAHRANDTSVIVCRNATMNWDRRRDRIMNADGRSWHFSGGGTDTHSRALRDFHRASRSLRVGNSGKIHAQSTSYTWDLMPVRGNTMLLAANHHLTTHSSFQKSHANGNRPLGHHSRPSSEVGPSQDDDPETHTFHRNMEKRSFRISRVWNNMK
jgi:hypothetical protein